MTKNKTMTIKMNRLCKIHLASRWATLWLSCRAKDLKADLDPVKGKMDMPIRLCRLTQMSHHHRQTDLVPHSLEIAKDVANMDIRRAIALKLEKASKGHAKVVEYMAIHLDCVPRDFPKEKEKEKGK